MGLSYTEWIFDHYNVLSRFIPQVITHHKFAVVALQYSRDDRFLVTAGDYRECSIAIWSTIDYELLATSSTRYPIHAVRWDPYTMNEFATVGQNGSVLFWLLDETKQQVALNVGLFNLPAFFRRIRIRVQDLRGHPFEELQRLQPCVMSPHA